MRPWLIAMLLLTAVLAGCADETPAPTDDHDGDHDGHDADDGHDDEDDGTLNNTAPVANLTADVSNGTAPLMINLTLDGSDADGDNLTWVLSLGGNETANGTLLPSELNFTLEAGNHTFVLSISDGNLTATANLTIVVEQSAPEEPEEPAGGLEDRDWYVYDPDTGLCHVKDYEDVGGAGVLYRSPLSSGDWFIAEANDVPGLQIEDNHPAAGAGSTPVGGFYLDLSDCTGGDQVVA